MVGELLYPDSGERLDGETVEAVVCQDGGKKCSKVGCTMVVYPDQNGKYDCVEQGRPPHVRVAPYIVSSSLASTYYQDRPSELTHFALLKQC